MIIIELDLVNIVLLLTYVKRVMMLSKLKLFMMKIDNDNGNNVSQPSYCQAQGQVQIISNLIGYLDQSMEDEL